MLELVTIADAREQLRLDDDAYDAWLAIAIPAVSEAVATWLKDLWRLYVVELDTNGQPVIDTSGNYVLVTDTSGNFEVRSSVRLAVLIELDSQNRSRDGNGVATVPVEAGNGYILCNAATSLLSGLRKPTLS